MPRMHIRSLVLANFLALAAAALCLILSLYFIYRSGLTRTSGIALATVPTLLSILMMNKLGLTNLSRIVLSLILPIASLSIIFSYAINNMGVYRYQPQSSLAVVLVISSIIPLLLFGICERKKLFVCLGINLFILLTFHPLYYYLSQDQTLKPITTLHYISANIVIVLSAAFLIACVYFLKNLFEQFELKNEKLIAELNDQKNLLEDTNRELYQLNQDIEAQNIEIQAQSEELLQSHESLTLANNEIERQRAELEIKNSMMEKSLDEKSRDLLQMNQQLVTHNSDLEQFSYTVSHNLRAPVASLLGLINLFKFAREEGEKKQLLGHLNMSAQSLETIISDLNKIIDLRHDKYHSYEYVDLEAELSLIKQSLRNHIDENGVEIHTDLQVKGLTSIKAYINSILFNFISNAIQYRSSQRKPIIHISTKEMDSVVILQVKDNGLGMDLQQNRDSLFKLYKRFHLNIHGKGLGLYIVKQQADRLKASIEVESEPDKGATFRVHFSNS